MNLFRRLRDSLSQTPLHKAAEEQNLAKFQYEVLRNPGLIDSQESSMLWTPLHIAAFKGSDPIVRELLNRGARHDIVDKEGRTALHLAAMNGFPKVVHDLIRGGASRTLRDTSGNTPYDYAIQRDPAMAAVLGGPPQSPGSVPPLSTPAALSGPSGHQLLPPPPAAAPAASFGANGGAFPRVPHDRAPVDSLLPPQPPTSQAPYTAPTAMTAAPAAAMYDTGWYGGGAAEAPSAPPYLPGAPSPGVHQPQYGQGQPYRPADNHLPYPTLPGTLPTPQQSQTLPPLGQSDGPQLPASTTGGGVPSTGGVGVAVQAPYTAAPPAKAGPPPLQVPTGAPPSAASSFGVLSPDVGREASGGSSGGGARTPGTARPGPTAYGSGGGEAADLDWGLTEPSDWGGEPDLPSAAPKARSGRANPILSARWQLEKLLGAGLAQLGRRGGGGSSPAAAAAEGGGGVRRTSGASVRSAGGSSAASSAVGGRLYSYEQLREATGGFSPLHKLGEGGYGSVYRGTLDGIPVAVKVMDTSPECMQGRVEFEAEVSILSALHHPHVVLLIGSCPERGMLVYELMTNSSLEAHLFGGRGEGSPTAAAAAAGAVGGPPGGNGGVALAWWDRVRIAAEVASALLFLHSARPPIVHMDLKPANILLDEHLTAKLGDVGLARLVPTRDNPAEAAARATAAGGKSTVLDTRLVGTFPYMDPEYRSTGQYSARSDLYALGIVMLQLLTGREGPELVFEVQRARDQPLSFSTCIDPRAGLWPAAEAVAFVDLALRCAQARRQDRPDLREVILPTLIQLRQRTQLYGRTPTQTPAPQHQQQQAPDTGGDAVPPMFLCPITQDVMDEPVVAADGYTYEKLAIAEWISRSHTSPLTNMRLEHLNLVDNRTLRSAIKEWRQRQHVQRKPEEQGPVGGSAGCNDPACPAQPQPHPPARQWQAAVARQDSGGW